MERIIRMMDISIDGEQETVAKASINPLVLREGVETSTEEILEELLGAVKRGELNCRIKISFFSELKKKVRNRQELPNRQTNLMDLSLLPAGNKFVDVLTQPDANESILGKACILKDQNSVSERVGLGEQVSLDKFGLE